MADGCDVLVFGAGPAGAATAVHLRKRELAVIVVDRAPPGRFRVGETVPPDIRPLLERLGVWPAFHRQGHLRSSGSASAWGTAELARADAFARPLGAGWHLDRARFDALLSDAARRNGAAMRFETRLLTLGARIAGRWTAAVVGRSGHAQTIRPRFLVDATGRSAAIARRLGARRICDDRLVCAHAVFDSCVPLERRSVVESSEHGWWYATPLPEGRALAGLFTDPRTCRARAYARPEPWHSALRATRHLFSFLGRPRPTAVTVAAATPHCLDRAAGGGWVAVGDAAASFDPLASAGLTCALRSAEEAAAALDQRDAIDCYSRTVRQRYSAYRRQRAAYYALEERWPGSKFWASAGRDGGGRLSS